MANVAERRGDPMETFFKGISALQQGVQTLTQYEMLNKQLSQEKDQADKSLVMKQMEAHTEALKAQTYAQQVMGGQGSFSPNVEFRVAAGTEPGSWNPLTKEARSAASKIDVEAAKTKGKLTAQEQKHQLDMIKDTFKEMNLNERQQKDAIAKFAEKGVISADVLAAAAAGQEIVTQPGKVIQPEEVLFEVSKLVGNKQLTAQDIVGKISSADLQKYDEKLKMTPREYLKKVTEAMKTHKDKKKEIMKAFSEDLPEIYKLVK
jgi:hypothetical protein